MDIEPLPSILAAVEQGRAGRGGTMPGAWSRHRARVLTMAQAGLTRGRLGGALGLGALQVGTLLSEGCDAVLRGGVPSAEADAVCRNAWQRWCWRGDAVACARL